MKNARLVYETADDDEGRAIYCPICKDFGDAQRRMGVTIRSGQRLCDLRKSIWRHFDGRVHKDALEERQKELRLNVRRSRIEKNIGKTFMKTSREGSSYVQFEMNLRDMQLSGLDIGTINHS